MDETTINKEGSDKEIVRLTPITIGEIIEQEIKEPAWVIKGLIPASGLVALSGAPGHGKTWLALEIARVVASGEPLFGKFETKQGGVLFIDEENGISTLSPRIGMLSIDGDLPINFLIEKGIKIDRLDDLRDIKTMCSDLGVVLVIIDPFIQIHRGDENDSRAMAKVIGFLKKLTTDGASVLLLHHHRKESEHSYGSLGERLRGSSSILAGVDSHIRISKKRDVIEVQQTKSRQAREIDPFTVRLIHDEGSVKLEYEGEFIKSAPIEEKVSAAIDELLNYKGELSREDITTALNQIAGLNAIDGVLKARVEAHTINLRIGPNNKHFYSP